MAHPFTARELARIVQECYHQPIDYRGIQRGPARHRLSPAALQHHRQGAQQASLLPPDSTQQLTLPLEPHTLAQRLALALGHEHLLLRFCTYDEYPTEEQANWRIIELLSGDVAAGSSQSGIHDRRELPLDHPEFGCLGAMERRNVSVHIADRWQESVVSETDGLVFIVDDGPPLAHDGRLRYNRRAVRVYVVGRLDGD
jgi:hypothetical protein